jgi:hypothetical protein
LIGGLPLLQTLAMMFSCLPVPFAKNGGFNFADTALGKQLAKLKSFAQRGVDAFRNGLNEFTNRITDGIRDTILTPLDNLTTTPFQRANEFFDKFTGPEGQIRLEAALPNLFGRGGAEISNVRTQLLNTMGAIQQNSDTYKIAGFSIGELINLAEESDSLARAMRDFQQHTDNLSGTGGAGTALEIQRLYGNVVYTGATANIASSNQVSPNLSSSLYPIIELGDLIVIDTQPRVVIDKNFTAAPAGTVSVDTVTDNVKVTTSDVGVLNLANQLISTSGTITLNTNMYISVNGEVRQVNTINSLGDYLTVYNPFYGSATANTLFVETSFNVNTAFATTKTDQEIKVQTSFVCNSVCLDNVITGIGTTFTSDLQANNKIFYDGREYIVVSVTDTTITVDDSLRVTKNYAVYKVTNETPYIGLDEDLVDPDGIVNAFTLPSTISGDSNFLNGFTVRVRKANGTYQSVNAGKPTDAAQALFQQKLMARVKEELNQMKYDLRDDAIRNLSDAQVIARLNNTITRFRNTRDEIKDIIAQDKAVLNAAKSLIKGMIKLFSLSCSKKKKKGGAPTDSDEYLDLILFPNPERQGCDATTSDFIDILDDFDTEYNDPGIDLPTLTANTQVSPITNFDDLNSLNGPFPNQATGAGTGEGAAGVDNQNPDVNVPEDPCAKPC